MKNKKTKLILISIIVLVILLFIVLFVLTNRINEKGGVQNVITSSGNISLDEEPEEDYEDEDFLDDNLEDSDNEEEYTNLATPEEEGLRDGLYTEKPYEVTSTTYYSTVKNIIETFLQDLGEMNKKSYLNTVNIERLSNADLRKKAYDRLTKDYIDKNDIDTNISEKLRMPYTSFTINVEKMMQYAIKGNQVLRFAVRLNIKDEMENKKNSSFIVYLDYENLSYAIEPIGNVDIENLDLKSEISEIEKCINNTYTYVDEE